VAGQSKKGISDCKGLEVAMTIKFWTKLAKITQNWRRLQL